MYFLKLFSNYTTITQMYAKNSLFMQKPILMLLFIAAKYVLLKNKLIKYINGKVQYNFGRASHLKLIIYSSVLGDSCYMFRNLFYLVDCHAKYRLQSKCGKCPHHSTYTTYSVYHALHLKTHFIFSIKTVNN